MSRKGSGKVLLFDQVTRWAERRYEVVDEQNRRSNPTQLTNFEVALSRRDISN